METNNMRSMKIYNTELQLYNIYADYLCLLKTPSDLAVLPCIRRSHHVEQEEKKYKKWEKKKILKRNKLSMEKKNLINKLVHMNYD